ncbi:MAG: hypothetical protein V4641_05430, partial [Pseudomonadota bacterium]
MTKTDWTKEKVRAMAEKLSAEVPRFNTEDERLCCVGMLTAFAERIEHAQTAVTDEVIDKAYSVITDTEHCDSL